MGISTANSNVVTRQDVIAMDAVRPPPSGRHYPIPYQHIIETVEQTMANLFGFERVGETYALGDKCRETGIHKTMFGLYTYHTGDDRFGLNVGFRGSHYQKLAAAIAAGAAVFVCDNGCFSGDSFVVSRKNTQFGEKEFAEMVRANAQHMYDDYKNMLNEYNHFESIDITHDRGFEILGLMKGHKVIKDQQLSVAYESWRNPPQEDWIPRNIFSLYNAVTEGLKKGSPRDKFKDQMDAHTWFRAFIADQYSAKKTLHVVPNILEGELV
tara:strand:- start:233 stop:1036 length:804 start_codon:yes stop_codon:yes gene_type:complete